MNRIFHKCGVWVRRVLAVLLPVAVAVPYVAARGTHAKWRDGAQQRRADYIFMEAQRQLALENNDAYFELLRRAYALDGGETSMGADLGFYMLMLGRGDETMSAKGMTLLEKHFEAHPDDYYATVLYGTVCERMGMTDRSTAVWEKLYEIYPTKTDVAMRLADAYLARTADTLSQSKAMQLLNRVEKAEGPSLQLTARRVMSHLSSRDTVAATGEVLRLVDETPRSAESRVYAGDYYMQLGDNAEALNYYNAACDVDPSSGLAYYKRAGYYKETGDSAAYDREVFRALELPDLEMDTKLEIFTGYVKEQYADTLMQPRINELFGKLIDQYPHEAAVHDLYSSFFVAIDDYASAAEQQEYVLDADISNEDRWRGLIGLYFSAREYDKAVDAGRRAMELLGEKPVFLLLAGEAASVTGDYDTANRYLHRVIEVDSTDTKMNSQAYTALGDILYKQGQAKDAIGLYEKAMTLDPGNAMAMNNCAYYMACEGIDLDRAAELSRRSLNLDPDNESSLDTYAWIMFKKGDYKESRAFIDRAMDKTAAPTAELYQHAGDIYYMNGEPDAAVEYWEKAAELEPDDPLLQKKIRNKAYYYK